MLSQCTGLSPGAQKITAYAVNYLVYYIAVLIFPGFMPVCSTGFKPACWPYASCSMFATSSLLVINFPIVGSQVSAQTLYLCRFFFCYFRLLPSSLTSSVPMEVFCSEALFCLILFYVYGCLCVRVGNPLCPGLFAHWVNTVYDCLQVIGWTWY